MKVFNEAKHIKSYILKQREYFHNNPEISGLEYDTSNKIIEELKKLKIEYERVGDYSIVAYINKKSKGKKIAFRAELDALPVFKEGASIKFDAAHLCGHDLHMAIMLGILKIFSERKIDFCLKVLFEEASESYQGAKKIANSGVIDDIDFIFSLHNIPTLLPNEVSIQKGSPLIGSDQIKIEFHGCTSHSALLSESIDTIQAASNFTDNIQSFITKSLHHQSLAIVVITKFLGGSSSNMIADLSEINLNFRYDNIQTRTKVYEIIKNYLKIIEAQYNITTTFETKASSLPTINNSNVVDIVTQSIEKLDIITNVNLDTQPFTDNFSAYLNKVPGAYGFFGVGFKNKTSYFNHHPDYNLNDDAIVYVTALYLQILYDQINNKENYSL